MVAAFAVGTIAGFMLAAAAQAAARNTITTERVGASVAVGDDPAPWQRETVTLPWHTLRTLLESTQAGDSVAEAMLTAEDLDLTPPPRTGSADL